DPWFFVEAAPDLAALIRVARQVNDEQPHFVVDLIRRALGGLTGKRIAILGLAYKPDVDDLRESPAMEIAHLLVKAGVVVTASEPYRSDAVIPGIEVFGTVEAASANVDAVVVLVAHKQFRELTPEV